MTSSIILTTKTQRFVPIVPADRTLNGIHIYKHIHRYYDEPLDETAILGRTVCKNCGEEGQHKTSACTVLIVSWLKLPLVFTNGVRQCLTCGARNEHLTRSCPIGKVCFTCGMKGHINAVCTDLKFENTI